MFYTAALGELELRRGRHEAAHKHFRATLNLVRIAVERRFIEQRVQAREPGDPRCAPARGRRQISAAEKRAKSRRVDSHSSATRDGWANCQNNQV